MLTLLAAISFTGARAKKPPLSPPQKPVGQRMIKEKQQWLGSWHWGVSSQWAACLLDGKCGKHHLVEEKNTLKHSINRSNAITYLAGWLIHPCCTNKCREKHLWSAGQPSCHRWMATGQADESLGWPDGKTKQGKWKLLQINKSVPKPWQTYPTEMPCVILPEHFTICLSNYVLHLLFKFSTFKYKNPANNCLLVRAVAYLRVHN